MSSIGQESNRNFEADDFRAFFLKFFFYLFAAAECMGVSASIGGVFVFSSENGGTSSSIDFGPSNL